MEQKNEIRILGIPVYQKRVSSEVRDLSDMKNPTEWLKNAFGVSSLSGVTVSEDLALQLSAVWACVKVLGETIAALPLNVYLRDNNGNRNVDRASNLQYLLHSKPNPLMTSYTFRETLMCHKVLNGNGYAIIHRDNKGEVAELELIENPNMVHVTKSRLDGRKYYSYNGKVYADYEMLHFMGFSRDGLKGVSVIQYARENFGSGIALQQFGNTFFKNGAHIDGYIKVPGKLDERAQKNLSTSWHSKYGGIENVGKTAILEGGAEFVSVSMTNEDAQYITSRKFSIEEIARIFRVPLHMINSLDKATNNNIEHQGIEFVQHTMTPHVVSWEQELDNKLLSPKSNRYIKFNLNALMRGDSVSRADFYQKMHMIGALDSNEARDLEDMNQYEGGSEKFVQVNMQPVKFAVKGPQQNTQQTRENTENNG